MVIIKYMSSLSLFLTISVSESLYFISECVNRKLWFILSGSPQIKYLFYYFCYYFPTKRKHRKEWLILLSEQLQMEAIARNYYCLPPLFLSVSWKIISQRIRNIFHLPGNIFPTIQLISDPPVIHRQQLQRNPTYLTSSFLTALICSQWLPGKICCWPPVYCPVLSHCPTLCSSCCVDVMMVTVQMYAVWSHHSPVNRTIVDQFWVRARGGRISSACPHKKTFEQ